MLVPNDTNRAVDAFAALLHLDVSESRWFCLLSFVSPLDPLSVMTVLLSMWECPQAPFVAIQ